jgi:hypothetical protein
MGIQDYLFLNPVAMKNAGIVLWENSYSVGINTAN